MAGLTCRAWRQARHGHAGVESGQDIRDRTPTFDGGPSTGPVMLMSPLRALDGEVVAGQVAPRPGAAEAGD